MEVYIKVVFESFNEIHESSRSEIGKLKGFKIYTSDKRVVAVGSNVVSGLVRDVASFIALRDRGEAAKIHGEAAKKLLDSGIIRKADQKTSMESSFTLEVTQNSPTPSYGRYGYIQGIEKGQWLWDIYMDTMAQYQNHLNYKK